MKKKNCGTQEAMAIYKTSKSFGYNNCLLFKKSVCVIKQWNQNNTG